MCGTFCNTTRLIRAINAIRHGEKFKKFRKDDIMCLRNKFCKRFLRSVL